MIFFSRELSQALQEAGCQAGGIQFTVFKDRISHWYWMKHKTESVPWLLNPERAKWDDVLCMAFTAWDLCGPSEISRENAEKLWPTIHQNDADSYYCKHCGDNLEHDSFPIDCATKHRHNLIDLPSHEEQEKYVWKTMRRSA